MATCVVLGVDDVLVATATAVDACTGLIVLTVAEFNAFSAVSWWNGLTLDDGGAIAGAILGVWLLGWAFGQIARLFLMDSTEGERS